MAIKDVKFILILILFEVTLFILSLLPILYWFINILYGLSKLRILKELKDYICDTCLNQININKLLVIFIMIYLQYIYIIILSINI